MRPFLVLVLLIGWCSLTSKTAHAQVAGDTCATAGIININGSYTFDITGASGDDPCTGGIPTEWYRFLALSDGKVSADLCGSSFNTYLTIFQGAGCPTGCGDILVQNNDSCGQQSAVTFDAVQGTLYYIAVSGLNASDVGPGVLNFSFTPSAGDTCATAGVFLGNGSSNFDLTTANAGDDPCDGPLFRTLWYRYTAPAPGMLRVDTCGSSYPTNVQAFITPGCPVTCDTRVTAGINPCEGGGLEFPLLAGQRAYFVVGGANTGDGGPGVFTLEFEPTVAGDVCADAGLIPGNGAYEFDLTSASAGDDPCDGPDWRTQWYQFKAPTLGTALINTCGSSVAINVQALKAGVCPVTCEDRVEAAVNPCGDNEMRIAMEPGESLFLVVGEFDLGVVGPGVLNFVFLPTVAGDNCAFAGLIVDSGRYPYDTTGASSDDPCVDSPNYPTVWYEFIAPNDGQTFFRVDDVTYFAYLTIWQGPACPTSCVGVIDQANPNTRPDRWITFPTTSGSSYIIAVGGAAAFGAGPGTLVVRHVPQGSRDINDDGIVNVADVTELGNMIDAGVPLTNEFADFDNDTDVDLADAQALAVFIAE